MRSERRSPNQPEWILIARRRQRARAEPAHPQVARGLVTAAAVDHGGAECASADRVLEADRQAAERDRSDGHAAHGDTESQRQAADGRGDADREAAKRKWTPGKATPPEP